MCERPSLCININHPHNIVSTITVYTCYTSYIPVETSNDKILHLYVPFKNICRFIETLTDHV